MSPATPSFTISKARLVGLFLECIAYGVSLVTIPLCIRALVWSRGRMRSLGTIHWITLIAALLLAFFATFDVIITLIWLIDAFVLYEGPGGAPTVFLNISDWINVMKSVNLIFPILIGDLILIYRCWIVYDKSYVVIFAPMIIWVVDAAMGSYILYIESHLHQQSTLQEGRLFPAFAVFFAMTVIQNVITTSLIIICIRNVNQLSAEFVSKTANSMYISTSNCWGTQLQRVMRIVIESGLIYTVTTAISLATYLPNAYVCYSVTDAELPIIVIAFNLIIIRCKRRAPDTSEHIYPYSEHSGMTFNTPQIMTRSTTLSVADVDDLESGACPKQHMSPKEGRDPSMEA
ncbi:hypothetical protein ONZ45_g12709 [Pleurotus djamor]|nr:hypothetical protein ONZ45_g12709 [Pleurotus djamor]